MVLLIRTFINHRPWSVPIDISGDDHTYTEPGYWVSIPGGYVLRQKLIFVTSSINGFLEVNILNLVKFWLLWWSNISITAYSSKHNTLKVEFLS